MFSQREERDLVSAYTITSISGTVPRGALGMVTSYAPDVVSVSYLTTVGVRVWRGTVTDFRRVWGSLLVPLVPGAPSLCALCSAPTVTRTAIPERSSGAQLPCCAACAQRHEPEDVPLRARAAA